MIQSDDVKCINYKEMIRWEEIINQSVGREFFFLDTKAATYQWLMYWLLF